jgi:hypothetical protein
LEEEGPGFEPLRGLIAGGSTSALREITLWDDDDLALV